MYLLLSLLPFAIITYFLVVKEAAASKVMFWAYLVTALSLFFVWKQPFFELFAASAKGLYITIDLVFIIAGVLLIFNLLRHTKLLDALEQYLLNLSDKKPIHIVLIGFFFVMFLEAIAGFGTPALIAAPLLVLVGLRPLSAVVLTLVADSMAVVFGAFGTPIVVGLQSVSADIASVTNQVAFLSGSVIVFLPTLMLFLYAYLEKKPFSDIKQYLAFALVSGLVTATIFVLSALLFGPELPSVIASLGGLTVMLGLLKLGVFSQRLSSSPIRKALPAIGSYLVIVFLLVASRINVFGFGDFLTSLAIYIPVSADISHTFSAYTPGVLILVSFAIILVLLRPNKQAVLASYHETITRSAPVVLTLLLTLMFAQLIIYSPTPSIASVIASLFSNTGAYYVFFASLLGAFGSFVAGSATVSNIMLSAVQIDAATINGVSESLVLALQTVGAGAGNMIAIHNILAVLAVVHIHKGMGRVLRINAAVALVIVLFVSLLALLL